MKLALAMAFDNEAHWIKRHLPIVLSSSALDGVVCISDKSGAGGLDEIREYTYRVGLIMHYCPERFEWNWGKWMNALLAVARDAGYDAILRLDPDECMFPDHIAQVRALLERYKAIRLPRYHIGPDLAHYYPESYPDYQTRAYHLWGHAETRESPIFYAETIHETPVASFRLAGWTDEDSISADSLHLYHYNRCLQNARFVLHTINTHRIMAGQEALKALPEGYIVPEPFRDGSEPFSLKQPVNSPIGETA